MQGYGKMKSILTLSLFILIISRGDKFCQNIIFIYVLIARNHVRLGRKKGIKEKLSGGGKRNNET